MWTCGELKRRAKNVLSTTYWNGIVANLIRYGISCGIGIVVYILVFIFMAIFMVASFSTSAAGVNPFRFSTDFSSGFSLVLIPVMVLFYAFIFAISFLVAVPIEVGIYKFFMCNRQDKPNYNHIFFAFKKGSYLKIVGAMLWLSLFTFLWGLPYCISFGALQRMPYITMPYYLKVGLIIFVAMIFIVSIVLLIYKSISYSMIAFILGDNPSIGYRRALKLSISMTRGHIGHIFLLELSFIGWCLLGLLACIIGILFVTPYLYATYAELYAQLRDNALRSRQCSFAELNFSEPGPEFYYQQ